MTLEAGQTLSHYEILGPLGAGAMGEVYRARDTKLGREVALKVLPAALAEDDEGLRRFEREARTLAALNHPNVAQVFGLDEVDGTRFIAMELVPGEDLAARLARGPLSIAETLDVARQVAEGVEAAHEAGVIHRDLKPANVVITPEQRVKVLDFGLAKPTAAEAGGGSTTDSVLRTGEGRLLGTPAYMAPEQARGQPVGRCVDVWAFGCLLYESLTGRRAFEGGTLSDVLASVIEREPDWSRLPARVTPRLRALQERCLRKDVRSRLQHLGDARIELEEIAQGGDDAPRAPASRGPLVPVLTILVLSATIAAAFGWMRPTPGVDPGRVAGNTYPITFGFEWDGTASWSPEGERIVFSRMVSGSTDLYIKPLIGERAELLVGGPGDEMSPTWSPDGIYVAYVTSGAPGAPLCLMRAEGVGEPRVLAYTNVPRLAINVLARCLGDRPWIDARNLVFSGALPTGQVVLHKVDIETGEVVRLSTPPVGATDFSGSVSGDGRSIVFERRIDGRGSLWTIPSYGGDEREILLDEYDNMSPSWMPDGRHLLYRSYRGESFRNLWELEIESGRSRRITGLTKDVWDFTLSDDGRIAYQPFWHDTFLWSVEVATGEHDELTTHRGDNFGGRYAPDGRIAYHSNRTGNAEIWSLDPETGLETNLTEHPAWDVYPDWSPDGSEIVFVSNRDGAFHLFVMRSDGGGKRRLETGPVGVEGTSIVNSAMIARWSPDGRRIAYIRATEEGDSLWTVGPRGEDDRLLIPRVHSFDWLRDGQAVFSRQEVPGEDMVMYAIDLATMEERELFRGPHTELDVAPDGSAIAFCHGQGHLGMKPHVLRLEPASEPGGLPTAVGEPVSLYPTEESWHAHNGGWSGDSTRLLFTWDRDYNDVFLLDWTGE